MHPEARLVVEPMGADNPDGLPVHRPDIVAHIDGVSYAIDVVVAEPAGARHMDHRELSSVTVPAGAARQAEAQTMTEYRGTLYEASLVPFALESTGRVGPSAKAFLERVGAQAPGALAALCGMGKLYVNTRSRLRGHVQ